MRQVSAALFGLTMFVALIVSASMVQSHTNSANLLDAASDLSSLDDLDEPSQQRGGQQRGGQQRGGQQRGFGGQRGRGRGGFAPPPPPLVAALDSDKDGEISAEELKNASEALATLDKNKDGELDDTELAAEATFGGFGRGGFGGFGGFGGGGRNTVRISPEELEFSDGAAMIADHAAFQDLSYKGEEVLIDTFLTDLEFLKFTIDAASSDEPQLYFINTNTHRAHMMFGNVAGLSMGGDQMKGVLVYRPMLVSPSGNPGLYTFEFEPFDAYSFEMIKICQDLLVDKAPFLGGNIGYYPRGGGALAQVENDKDKYDGADVVVYRDEDLTNADVGYLPLNPGKSFGRLRLMEIDEMPGPRDIVLYETLPNELSRVAGIITSVRQTPLSHVNLRAIQDKVPNAFVANAVENERIRALIGKNVAYGVTSDGFEIREASTDEVDAHFANLRPKLPQVPQRDLQNKDILPLEQLKFESSSSVGVKAANLATMHTFGFPKGTVPDGYAIPFYYYDEFMKHNGFYSFIDELLRNPEFQKDQDARKEQLKTVRSLIKKGKMPEWMMSDLAALHQSFPAGTSIRCRSSTNNEDLPGYSGAGLYDSYTHHPDEGHFSKSVKQVFASLWNLRAFEEREFYRVDHFSSAMGVLVHRNFRGEIANGVAVTEDIFYQTQGNYYVNTQVGEDLVTNPEEESVPEEALVDWWDKEDYQIMRASNRSGQGEQLLSKSHVQQLSDHLAMIHARFARLYGKTLDDPRFAMEIEFKVTKEGQLAIKQARPWVFTEANSVQEEQR